MTTPSLAQEINSHGTHDVPKPPEQLSEKSRMPTAILNPLLKNIPPSIVRRAWFTMAHLIMPEEAAVLDIRCRDGIQTYAMAVLNPEVQFIGIDPDTTSIEYAKKNYKLPNLKFMSGHFQENFIPKESIDAIINSFSLYETYAQENGNEQAVIESIKRQFDLLKPGGQIFIQSQTLKSFESLVLLELTDEPRYSEVDDEIHKMSDVELLEHYSEHAGPREGRGYRGFYLEELPPRFPRTQLFRLPEKWAYEFVLRKDDRDSWEENIHKEFSFFTRRDFRRIFKNFGARILYSAPHWDDQIIKKRFNKKFRMFNEDGSSRDIPETSFIILAQKVGEKESLVLQERKPSSDDTPSLRLMTMRNEIDGTLVEVASRNTHITEIMPYRVTKDGRLHIFVNYGMSRALANTIPRSGVSLDGKKWSGHMTETISFPQEIIETIKTDHFRSVLHFSQDYMGLKPKMGSLFDKGPGFYPAPDCLDEHIETFYLEVDKPKSEIEPILKQENEDGFSSTCNIFEIDAQQILNAVGVGLIPTTRLEIQILSLYEKLGISYQSWADCPLNIETEEPEKITKLQEIISKLAEKDNRLVEVKNSAGQLKTVKSIFVDEGKENGSVTGLGSEDIDFILSEENSMNTAIVLPLTRGINGEVMAGLVEQYLPAPQRYRGNGYMITCPSFPLPKDITNLQQAKQFVADKFEIPVEHVARMGESYFSHIGVTPQRIYPFAVTTPGPTGWITGGRTHGTTLYSPLKDIWKIIYWDNNDSFLKIAAMAYQSLLCLDSDMSLGMSFSHSYSSDKANFALRSEASMDISLSMENPTISMDSGISAPSTSSSALSTGMDSDDAPFSLTTTPTNDSARKPKEKGSALTPSKLDKD